MADSNLKRRLASDHGQDKAAYQAGKAEYIARIEKRAEEEKQAGAPSGDAG